MMKDYDYGIRRDGNFEFKVLRFIFLDLHCQLAHVRVQHGYPTEDCLEQGSQTRGP